MPRRKKNFKKTEASASQQPHHDLGQEQQPPPDQLQHAMEELQRQKQESLSKQKQKQVITNNEEENQKVVEMPPPRQIHDKNPLNVVGKRKGKELEDDDEYIDIDLSTIKPHLTCPICLGIFQQAQVVTLCFHRFCKECINKSMRLGNRQCPTCRKSLPSRRFLREDHLCNRLVAALYPNMNSSWQEDVELTDEEKAQTEQIQAAFAEMIRKQAKAVPNRVKTAGASGSRKKSQGSGRRGRRRKNQNNGIQISDNDEEAQWTDGGRDSSSADPPYSPTNSAMELDINEQVAVTAEGTGPANNEFVSLSGVGSWGKGRQRSQTLRGTGRGSKNGRKGNHVNRLANHLDQLRIDRNNQELDICVALIALNEQTLPRLEQPYVSCQPTFSVKQLCQYVAEETRVPPREVDILLVSEPSFATSGSLPSYDPSKGELQSLHPQETVEGLQTSCTNTEGVLVLGYMRKPSN